jgi:hypothetical protein
VLTQFPHWPPHHSVLYTSLLTYQNYITAAFPSTLEITGASSMRRYEPNTVEQFYAVKYFCENFKNSDVGSSNFFLLKPQFLTVLKQWMHCTIGLNLEQVSRSKSLQDDEECLKARVRRGTEWNLWLCRIFKLLYDVTSNLPPFFSTLWLEFVTTLTWSECFRKGDRTSFILSISGNDDEYLRTNTW